ncbi:Flp pilus assembly protein CpaB [Lacticigenium naphthae]|uniref:Flp pilus assembly protein CpaB n=1 Tax=Lacticigenium naphthae TaxID=515351 RepID=UPI0003F5C7B1|nr:Flp pilus assembly protein CpaB [Lacticigenium naphthae]
MNNKKVWGLALLFSLIVTISVFSYIESIRQEPVAPPEVEQVVFVKQLIPQHTVVTEEMVEMRSVPAQTAHSEAYRTISEVVGGMTNTDVLAGEQVLQGRIVTEGNVGEALAYRIPASMRAVTVPVDEISGVGGYLKEGNRIDVLVYYPGEEEPADDRIETQFQNVKILQVGPAMPPAETEGSGVTTSLTLLVSPEMAEEIALARANGSFTYTLRNPGDNQVEQTVPESTPEAEPAEETNAEEE